MKHTPKKDRMNRIDRMKSPLFPILSILLILSFSAPATLVTFPVAQMYGGAQYVRPFTLTAQYPVTTDGVNLYAGTSKLVTPSGGTNPVVQLTPNNYLLTFSDARQPLRFPVPLSTNTLNVLNLITNGLLTLTNWNPFAVAGFTGTVTNLAQLAGSQIVTNAVFITSTNSSTNFCYVTTGALAGNYLWSSSLGYYTNLSGSILLQLGNNFPSPSWEIINSNNTVSANQFDDFTNSSDPTGNYTFIQGPSGQFWVYAGAGTFYWYTTNAGSVVSTNAWPNHFNLTTFNNGVCQTNIFQ